MRKILMLFIALSFLLINSCKEDGSTEPTDDRNPGNNTVTENIGSSGGEIGNDDFTLVVPSGAFSDSYELKVSEGNDDSGYDVVSDVFKLEGFPSDLREPVKLRVKANTTSENVKIMFKYDNLIKSEWKNGLGTMFLDAQLVDGFYEATLDIESTGRPMMAKANDDPLNDYSVINPYVSAILDIQIIESNNGLFKIHYPLGVSEQSVAPLVGYLNNAFNKIKQMGFDVNRRDKWPLLISLEKLADNVDGQACFSWWGINYSSIQLNTNHLNNSLKMKTSVGHELLHIFQDFYDPSGKTHLWLDEATAVWFEELVSEKQDYVSEQIVGFEHAPFKGIAAVNKMPLKDNNKEDQTHYGYGLAPLIKYIVEMEGEQVVAKMYEEIEKGTAACNVIEEVTNESIMYWLESFYSDYILLNLYSDMSIITFTDGIATEEIEMTNMTENLRITERYDDVSARLYKIKFDYLYEEQYNYRLYIEPQWASTAIYKYKGSNIEKLGYFPGATNIYDTNHYLNEKTNLLILVFNGIRNSTFTGSKNISLVLEPKEMQQTNLGDKSWIRFDFNYRRGIDEYAYSGWSETEITNYDSDSEILTGYAEYSDTYFQGTINIEINFSDNGQMIDELTYHVVSSAKGNSDKSHSFEIIKLVNIPITYIGSDDLEYNVDDNEVCSKVASYEMKYWNYDGELEYDYGTSSVWCDSESQIRIEITK
jgi:hypothetical protein